MPLHPRHACSICGHDMRTCTHPWKLPFSEWPAFLRERLKQMLPKGPHARS